MGKCVYKNRFDPQEKPEKPQPILVILIFFRFWREFCGTSPQVVTSTCDWAHNYYNLHSSTALVNQTHFPKEMTHDAQ